MNNEILYKNIVNVPIFGVKVVFFCLLGLYGDRVRAFLPSIIMCMCFVVDFMCAKSILHLHSLNSKKKKKN